MKTMRDVRMTSIWSLGLWALIVGIASLSNACMDPAYYEDPVESDVSNADSESRNDPEVGADGASPQVEQDVDDQGSDSGLVDSDTESADTGIEVRAESCSCLFDLPVTTPLPQTFVWLTGDFVDPPWSMDISEGALELELNSDTANWEVVGELANGQLLNYKYLVGWADNPGPVWGNEEGDFSADAANSSLLVVCGEAPCNLD